MKLKTPIADFLSLKLRYTQNSDPRATSHPLEEEEAMSIPADRRDQQFSLKEGELVHLLMLTLIYIQSSGFLQIILLQQQLVTLMKTWHKIIMFVKTFFFLLKIITFG